MTQIEMFPHASTPKHLITEDEWFKLYYPIPNPYKYLQSGFDYGDGTTMLSLMDATTLLADRGFKDSHLWTIVQNDHFSKLYIEHGVRHINALGYMVTEKAPYFRIDTPIPCDN